MAISIVDVLDAVESSSSFNGFRQEIMHLQNKLTDTDIARDARKRSRKLTKKEQFDIASHKKACEGLDYEEFLDTRGAD